MSTMYLVSLVVDQGHRGYVKPSSEVDICQFVVFVLGASKFSHFEMLFFSSSLFLIWLNTISVIYFVSFALRFPQYLAEDTGMDSITETRVRPITLQSYIRLCNVSEYMFMHFV